MHCRRPAGAYEYSVANHAISEIFPSFKLDSEPFEITSFALSLLLVFRTDASYARYKNALDAWSEVKSTCKVRVVQPLWRVATGRAISDMRRSVHCMHTSHDMHVVCRGKRGQHTGLNSVMQSSHGARAHRQRMAFFRLLLRHLKADAFAQHGTGLYT